MSSTRTLFIATALLVAADAGAAGCNLSWADGYIPLAPPGASMWAGYGTLRNSGDAPVLIERIRSAQFGDVSLHETRIEDGVSRMRELTHVEVPAHGALVFAPGGRHLMLMEPSTTPAAGASVELSISAQGCEGATAAKLEMRTDDVPAQIPHAH